MPDAGTARIQAYHRGVLSTELAALTGTSAGHMIAITGHTTAGDGGEGFARWDASDSSTTDNGGTVWGSGTGRWKRVFEGTVIQAVWFGAGSSTPATVLAAIQSAIAALATYSGIDFGSRTYNLGTRTGASDTALQLYLNGLADKTLYAQGATFTWETTNQVSGYFPILFKVNNCQRIAFDGTWNFVDTKAWSLYTSYGATATSAAEDWSGFSGMYAISVQEQCSDLRFGHMRFENTSYGIGISGIDGALPSDANRTKRVSIASLHADDVLYPLLCAENGDDLSCPQLHAYGCGRPFFFFGCSNITVNANVRQSIHELNAAVARKKRDTKNIDITLRYDCDNGFPVCPFTISLAPVAATGDPVIEGLRVKLTCAITTVDATRERQYACQIYIRDTAGNLTDYTTTSGSFRGLELDIDKGKFEYGLGITPSGDTTNPYEKIPVAYVEREHSGGTYNQPIAETAGNVYGTLARKVRFERAPTYEFVSSEIVHGSYVYPISGWAPWKDSGLATISLANHTYFWRWVRMGPLVHYEFFLKFGASGAYPSGAWYFPLPYTPSLAGESNPPRQELGDLTIYDNSASDLFTGKLYFDGAGYNPRAICKIKDDGAGVITAISTLVTDAAPFTFATNDTLRINAAYTAHFAL